MLKYLQSYSDFLNESLSQTKGIKQSQVEKTIEHIKQNLFQVFRLDEVHCAFVGSAGKKSDRNELSHNINLGINSKILKESNNVKEDKELFEFIVNQIKRLGYKSQVIEERNQVNVDWPILGKEKNGFVELRIKLTENLDWLRFARHSEKQDKKNKYGSKYREAILASVAESIKKDILEYYDDKDVVKEFEVYSYDAEEGLFTISKSFEGKNGILKKSRILEESKRLKTNDAEEFTKVLFGENVRKEDIMTFEQILEIVNSDDFVHKKKRKRILEKLKHKLLGLRLKVPEELM